MTLSGYTGPMTLVAERILPAYQSALNSALLEAAGKMPEGPWRKALLQLQRRSGSEDARERLASLERLALLAESRGWIDSAEAIVLRKLAFRVAVLEERSNTTT